MNNKNVKIKVKNLIRILALVSGCIFFLPTFLVSCSGQSSKISAAGVTKGYKSMGEQIQSPQPAALLFLIIPIVIILIWSLSRFIAKQKALFSVILTIADLVLWMYFRSKVSAFAKENYFEYKTTQWFGINLLILFIILILNVLILIGMVQAEMQVGDLFAKAAISGSSDTANAQGFCTSCGNPLMEEDCFCMSCGAKVE